MAEAPPNLDEIKHPLIDVWAVLADPEIPGGVGQRLLARQAAVRNGREPESVPEADKPFLSRHVVMACAAHDEVIARRGDQEWTHLSDNQPCLPVEIPSP